MVINHLLTGMILQVETFPMGMKVGEDDTFGLPPNQPGCNRHIFEGLYSRDSRS